MASSEWNENRLPSRGVLALDGCDELARLADTDWTVA
jgi:hypothetical protein